MISRITAIAIAEFYEKKYTTKDTTGFYYDRIVIDKGNFYDFLYKADYEEWFLNSIKDLYGERAIQEWVMRLHTGETISDAYPNYPESEKQLLGIKYLEKLAEDALVEISTFNSTEKTIYNKQINSLKRTLELDGYIFQNGKLQKPESDAIDIKEAKGVLKNLYEELNLGNQKTAFHHLDLSEQHFIDQKWDDSISNSRKFFESVLRETVKVIYENEKGIIPNTLFEKPQKVRDYLEAKKIIETKEKEAIAKLYGLLSHTGGHPYMAKSDQARLLRNLALTLSQFVLLSFKGLIKRENK